MSLQPGAIALVCGLTVVAASACDYLGSAARYVSASMAASPLATITDVPLPGGADRLDYQSLDDRTGRLFIAHLGSSLVHVYDNRASKLLDDVPDVADVHGVLAVPALGRVYASATGTHEVAVIDAASLKVIARAPAGQAPDGLAYAPSAHAVFVSDEGGSSESVIDTNTNQRIGQIELGGEAGNTQFDSVSGHIFVNVQPRDEIAELDPGTRAIVARHPVANAGGAHGLLLDEAHRQAYVAGEASGRVTLVDMQTWQVLDSQPVGAVPDVLALDAGRGLVYVASESGTVSVFKAGGAKLAKLAEGYAAAHAHTIAVDPGNHQLYLPLENVDGKPVLRIAKFDGAP